jgi:hypothetical protein
VARNTTRVGLVLLAFTAFFVAGEAILVAFAPREKR